MNFYIDKINCTQEELEKILTLVFWVIKKKNFFRIPSTHQMSIPENVPSESNWNNTSPPVPQINFDPTPIPPPRNRGPFFL